jgi:hypothetical protein
MSPALASTGVTGWWDARIIGHDSAHLPIYLAYAQEQAWYDGWCVTGASTQHWQWADDFFDIVFQTAGEGFTNGCWNYYKYNYVHNNSCGFPSCSFPDVDAWIQPSVWAYGNGAMACDFWDAWGGNPGFYGLHNHYVCQQIS